LTLQHRRYASRSPGTRLRTQIRARTAEEMHPSYIAAVQGRRWPARQASGRNWPRVPSPVGHGDASDGLC